MVMGLVTYPVLQRNSNILIDTDWSLFEKRKKLEKAACWRSITGKIRVGCRRRFR